MLRTISLFFLFAGIAFLFADIEIITLNPWNELSRLGRGFMKPDFSILWQYKILILNTITFAICGIILALIFAIPLHLILKLNLSDWAVCLFAQFTKYSGHFYFYTSNTL